MTETSAEQSLKVLKVLGIIPARGGSKSIPRKNVVPLAGKPLIVWTIEAAQRARLLDRLVVSTDDDEISRVAREARAETIARPPEIATDTSQTEPALLHALDYLASTEGYVPDAIALLQCTSPLRGSDIIDAAITKLAETGCDVVMTVAPLQHWDKRGQTRDGDIWAPEYDYAGRKFSQEVAEIYSENGALYVTRTAALREHNNRLGGEVRVIVMDPVRSIDIDSSDDLALAEEIMLALNPTAHT